MEFCFPRPRNAELYTGAIYRLDATRHRDANDEREVNPVTSPGGNLQTVERAPCLQETATNPHDQSR